MSLTGSQARALSGALRDAFTLARFDQMLYYHLGRKREDLALGDDYAEIVFKVIRTAVAEGWPADLVVGARAANPGHPGLRELAADLQLAPAAPEERVLERIIVAEHGYLDVAAWRERLGMLESQVARIEYPVTGGTVVGTAALIAPDLVLTNHHVVAPVVSGAVPASAVAVRFDYRRLGSGTVVSEGVTVGLDADEPIMDSSPPSPLDEVVEPTESPQADHLDYAVLRLGSPAGEEPIGGAVEDPQAPVRGWIDAVAPDDPLTADSTLFVLQHPAGDPLKLAFDAVIGLNTASTRLRHKVNTERGSSGSPCFNRNLDLVALHHSGDPNFDPAHKPAYNQAVPIRAIIELLTSRGHGAAVFVKRT